MAPYTFFTDPCVHIGTVGGFSIPLLEVKFLEIYGRLTSAKAFAKDVFIDQERRLGDLSRSSDPSPIK